MAKNDTVDEDYWNDSKKKTFNLFEEDESGGFLGVSLQGTAKLSQQLRDFDRHSSLGDTNIGKCHLDPVLPLLQLISEPSLKLILESHKTTPSLTQLSSPEELITKLLLGLPAPLECCRSLSSKSQLLTASVKSGNGEAILTVTLFVLKTLSKKHSYQLLRENPLALTHYTNYLTAREEYLELCNLLEALGHSKSAAMVHYKLACFNKPNIQKQIQQLNMVLKSHFHNDRDQKYLASHIKLLEFQLENNQESGLTAQKTIIQAAGKNTTDALRIFALSLGISERIFQWTCLGGKANLHDWNEVQAIFQTKSWLGGQKFKTLIPITKIVLILQNAKAPKSEISRYVRLVEDVLERQALETSLAALSTTS